MSLLHCDSFDLYGTTLADVARRWSSTSLNSGFTATSRTGAKAITLSTANHMQQSVSNLATVIAGIAFKPAGVTVNNPVIIFRDGTTDQVLVRVNTSAKLEVVNGDGTVLGTGTTSITTTTFWYLEFKATIGSSSAYEVRLNGVTEISGTGDTQNTANAYVTAVRFAPSGHNITFDDCYIADTAGANNNDFLGAIRIEAILPSGAGNTTGFTPSAGSNYECVDEADANDDTDYVSAASVGTKDTYAMGDLATLTAGTVRAVAFVPQARVDTSGARDVGGVARTGGADHDTSAQATVNSTSYKQPVLFMEQNPDTGAAWTIAEINAAEFGLKITG